MKEQVPENSRHHAPEHNRLLSAAAGKHVLMLGPLGNYAGYRNGLIHLWDYAYLKGIAASIKGIDINEELVNIARADGFGEIEFGTAENFNYEQNFDYIIAPDLIEHLGRPLDCLLCCKRALLSGGKIVMETPNPIGIDTIVSALVSGDKVSLPEHTCWIDRYNAKELARRAGLGVNIETYTPLNPYSTSMHWRTKIYRFITRFRPKLGTKLVFTFTHL